MARRCRGRRARRGRRSGAAARRTLALVEGARSLLGQNWDNDPRVDPHTIVTIRRPAGAPATITVGRAVSPMRPCLLARPAWDAMRPAAARGWTQTSLRLLL
jgi:hypothetical protein